MKIIVNNNYTYECSFKVKKGDRVVLSTPYWLRDVKGATWVGKVTSTKSDYDGYCEKVLGVE
jgi:hypothetical protein